MAMRESTTLDIDRLIQYLEKEKKFGAKTVTLWGQRQARPVDDEASRQPNEQGNIPTERCEGLDVTIVN